MKKFLIIVLFCFLLAGCSADSMPAEVTNPSQPNLTIGNPWKDYHSLQEAESASGLNFPLPEVIADAYIAESFRVMNGELLEVVYRDEEFKVTVRMKSGEEQDISGVYGEAENVRTSEVDGASITDMYINGGFLQLISKDGYSYSLYAPNHYWGDSNAEFLQYICGTNETQQPFPNRKGL